MLKLNSIHFQYFSLEVEEWGTRDNNVSLYGNHEYITHCVKQDMQSI